MRISEGDGSEPALDELTQAYEREDLVIMAGAAVSVAAGLPSWHQLIKLSVEHARALGAGPGLCDEILELARQDKLSDALSAVKLCLRPNEFGSFIEQRLDDQCIDDVPDIASAIGALQPHLRAVLTTNLDGLLERAFRGAWPPLARATPNIGQRRRFILKLHGTLLDRSTWVITKEDHERAMYTDPVFRNVLEGVFSTRTVLFVGCEPMSEDIEEVFARARAISGAQPPRHFALVPGDAGATPHRRARLDAAGVRVIDYGNRDGKHAEAAQILRHIAGKTGDSLSAPAERPPETRTLFAGCPFPGLEAFNESLASVFFGREAEISEATGKLGITAEAHRRWLQIEGPSGVGKSSLARAGIVAAARKGWIAGAPEQWHVAVLRPGRDPVTSLAHAVEVAFRGAAGEPAVLDKVTAELRTGGGALAALLRRYTPAGYGFLLVIDQLEEVFTLVPAGDQALIDALLAGAVRDRGSLYLVTTIRSDFTARLGELPELHALLNAEAVRYNLKPMGMLGLRRALVGPVSAVGLKWEDCLPDEVLEDASPSEGRLPLVAHVLRMLWDSREGNVLTKSAYKTLGGVSGALTNSADAIVSCLQAGGQERARKLLLRLVRSGRGKEDTRRTATRAEALLAAGGGSDAERVLLRLSGGTDGSLSESGAQVRLVVVSKAEDGEDRVDLVHEALLREWNTLREWVDRFRKDIERQEDLKEASVAWNRADESKDYLAVGGRLAYLRDAEPSDELSRRFLEASERRERELAEERQRHAEERVKFARRNTRRLGVLALGLLMFLVLAVQQFLRARAEARKAENAANNAEEALRIQQGARATQTARDLERATEALVLGIDSVGRNGADPSQAPPEAVEGLVTALMAVRRVIDLRGHVEPVSDVAFSPDGSLVATASYDQSAALWDAQYGTLVKLLGHTSPVDEILFSTNGSRIITRTRDGMVYLWSALSGDLLHAFENENIGLIAVSHDERFAAVSEDDAVSIRSALTGTLHAKTPTNHRHPVTVIAFAPDGSLVAVGASDGTTHLWDAHTGKLAKSIEQRKQPGACPECGTKRPRPATQTVESYITAMAFSPGGWLAIGDLAGAVRLGDEPNSQDESECNGHKSGIETIAFSPDGSLFATGSTDQSARLWNTSCKQVHELSHDGWVESVAFSPDGAWLATVGGHSHCYLWTVHRGEGRLILVARESLDKVAFSPDGERLAVAGSENIASLVDARIGKPLRAFRANPEGVNDLAFSPDGSRLITRGDYEIPRVWNAHDGTLISAPARPVSPLFLVTLRTRADAFYELAYDLDGSAEVLSSLDGSRVVKLARRLGHEGDRRYSTAAFSPNGLRLVTAGYGHVACMWNLRDGKHLRDLDGHAGQINVMAFSPDGSLIVTGNDDGTAKLWRESDGKCIATFPNAAQETTYSKAIRKVAFSPDGSRVVAANSDGMAWIWNTHTNALVSMLEGHKYGIEAVAFSNDSSILVTGGNDASARIWDAQTGKHLGSFDGGHGGPILAVAFSLDGSKVATGSDDVTACLWDVSSHKLLGRLPGYVGPIKAVAFSPDGRYLALGGGEDRPTEHGGEGHDGTVRIYPATAEGFLIQACQYIRPMPEFAKVAETCAPYLDRSP